MIYQTVNQAVLGRLPQGLRHLLDLGCGGGAFGQAAKAATGCHVTGVTWSEQEAAEARGRLDAVVVADLDTLDPAPLGRFDCIVCSHVLEHLRAPEQLLRRLPACLAPGGTLVVALPNVLFWKQRLQFLQGRFRYTDGGLMDATHLRFYDWHSAQQLVAGSGFAVVERLADGGLPLSRLAGAALARRIDRVAARRWPGLLGHQFVLSGRLPRTAAGDQTA